MVRLKLASVLLGASSSVGIHEHCTVAEILVFGRETGFSTQTLQNTLYTAESGQFYSAF
jgi:hypothetical protein